MSELKKIDRRLKYVYGRAYSSAISTSRFSYFSLFLSLSLSAADTRLACRSADGYGLSCNSRRKFTVRAGLNERNSSPRARAISMENAFQLHYSPARREESSKLLACFFRDRSLKPFGSRREIILMKVVSELA